MTWRYVAQSQDPIAALLASDSAFAQAVQSKQLDQAAQIAVQLVKVRCPLNSALSSFLCSLLAVWRVTVKGECCKELSYLLRVALCWALAHEAYSGTANVLPRLRAKRCSLRKLAAQAHVNSVAQLVPRARPDASSATTAYRAGEGAAHEPGGPQLATDAPIAAGDQCAPLWAFSWQPSW